MPDIAHQQCNFQGNSYILGLEKSEQYFQGNSYILGLEKSEQYEIFRRNGSFSGKCHHSTQKIGLCKYVC